jgi:glucoamylase
MTVILSDHPAGGGPGIKPRWTRSDKKGVGTAHSTASRIWFTVSKGIINEVYYPTIDRPQIRDLQYMITDGKTFFHGDRQLDSTHKCLRSGTLGYRITSVDPQGRYRIEKDVIAAPGQDCLLIRTHLTGDAKLLSKVRLFALLAPHLQVGGLGNNANVADDNGRKILTANKGDIWLALAATIPFLRCSCGYVGSSDGWHDLSQDLHMNCQFDCAIDGNVALTGELDITQTKDFVLAMAFGDTLERAVETLNKSLESPFEDQLKQFNEQWEHADSNLMPLKENITGDGGELYKFSRNLIRAHEDKTYKGAIIASLSIPWGAQRSDGDLGGYHLVWTRDMCHSATGLLAAGITDVPLRALIYLAGKQHTDGGFYQNFWVNGEPHWRGIQLDETAFPIMLAWQMQKAKQLEGFDPYPMVLKAASYLIEHGPVTPQERWEENSGFSPSTLAAQIAALVCAGAFARINGHESTASYLEGFADFLESHLEQWTVTTESRLVSHISRHFIRIHPADADNPSPDENANTGMLQLSNQEPGSQTTFAAKEIVDAGFLELVRYGIRKAEDRLIEDSLNVADALLRVDTPHGPCWRRYNNDGYGQRADGTAYQNWGYGHAWPVLTGERGHYELAAGRDAGEYIRAMEGFASDTLLLAEQVWSLTDKPEADMFLGRPTGGAMPLAWAHAEYLQLVRSVSDQRVFTLIDEVFNRYCLPHHRPQLEIWKFNRQVHSISSNSTLRIQAAAPFRLHWTKDQWLECNDTDSTAIETGHHYADLKISADQTAPISFTFFWQKESKWEGRDFQVHLAAKV